MGTSQTHGQVVQKLSLHRKFFYHFVRSANSCYHCSANRASAHCSLLHKQQGVHTEAAAAAGAATAGDSKGGV